MSRETHYAGIEAQCWFSIECPDGEISSEAVGEVRGGFRVHIAYTGGKTKTDPKPPDGSSWLGLNGTIVSGADWALVRSDAVVVFDGRMTIKQDGTGHLIDCILSATVDLTQVNGDLPEAAFRKWRAGQLGGSCPAVIAIRFETAPKIAADDPDLEDEKKFEERKQNIKSLMLLTRGQFVAAGTLMLRNEPYCPIQSARFDVYGLKASSHLAQKLAENPKPRAAPTNGRKGARAS